MPHIPELYRKFEPQNPEEIGENMHSHLEGGFRSWLHQVREQVKPSLRTASSKREITHDATQVAAADLKELLQNHKHFGFGTLNSANLAWSTAVTTLDK